MNRPATVKKSFLFIFVLLYAAGVTAQDCLVDIESLKGTYTGECKKGKANGKGKAAGIDRYEGDFKAGLPDGTGTYRWSNGNEFTGEFVKGLKQGKGKLTWKRDNNKDSVITGFWKKDVYAGLYEFSYTIISKSKMVTETEVEYKKDDFNRITFFITNTSGGAGMVEGNEMPKLKVDEVHAMTGAYGRLTVNDNHVKKTESIIDDVRFPFRMKAIIGNEEVEIEFREAGSYTISLRIND